METAKFNYYINYDETSANTTGTGVVIYLNQLQFFWRIK